MSDSGRQLFPPTLSSCGKLLFKEEEEERKEGRRSGRMFVVELSLLLLSFYLSVHLIKRRIFSTKSHLPPSPPKLPIIGNLHQLGSMPHHSLHALSKKHGNLMLLHLGRIPTLVASSADVAREIMKTHDLTFASRPSLKVARLLLSGGMDLAFTPYSEHWRQVRKICVTHLLSAKVVESYRLMREEEVGFMTQKIHSRASSHVGALDMSEILYSFANDVICRVVSGKFFREEGRNVVFGELIEETSELLGAFHVGDYLPYLAWIDVFSGLHARSRRNAERWEDVLNEIIKNHADRSEGDRLEGVDFVDVLLSLQKDSKMDFVLTKEYVRALLVDMFFAGTDTSYIVLEWAMAELLRSPETMRKLQDEVRGVAAGKSELGEEDTSKMSYLKAVLKEVLRLHPPAPLLLPRESMEDCNIGCYEIPKQTRVIINAWAIARDPRFWEAPDEFRPERFIESSVDFKGNDFEFIPFGAGRRICPGMKFAVSTSELALANLIQQFDWELHDGTVPENLDMCEAPGLTTRRKERLQLLAKPYYYKNMD